MSIQPTTEFDHRHVYLAADHKRSEQRTWWVIYLCGAMMLLEIVGGMAFGSIALVADGLHMSTHASALLLAALAYSYARKHADDPRFSFGTGKLGDLAGFTSAIVLSMIALLIGYEAVTRFFDPVPIHFAKALPIAALGLGVNIASALLLTGGGHDHGHAHADHEDHDETKRIDTSIGAALLQVFEDGVPPRFRLRMEGGRELSAATTGIETIRPDGTRQRFTMQERSGYLESQEEIAEPHAFRAHVTLGNDSHEVTFEEREHGGGAAVRDNNMRAAVVHVIADAAVSVLVIVGLGLARIFGWSWIDPAVGVVGAFVIASWAFGLLRDTGRILLDMTPDREMAHRIRETVEAGGDKLADLHLWRLGPGHLGAILSVSTVQQRAASYYRARLTKFKSLSHLTIEVNPR